MITSTKKIEGRTVLKVLRDIDDMQSGDEFKNALMDLYNTGSREIIIDFGEINLINSHAIGKILMFYRRFKEVGGTIYVTPLKGNIKKIFESLMLDKLIPEIKLT
jgi:anti-anti-sigma factor